MPWSQFKQVPQLQGCFRGKILYRWIRSGVVSSVEYTCCYPPSLLPCMDFSSKYSQVERRERLREKERKSTLTIILFFSSLAFFITIVSNKGNTTHPQLFSTYSSFDFFFFQTQLPNKQLVALVTRDNFALLCFVYFTTHSLFFFPLFVPQIWSFVETHTSVYCPFFFSFSQQSVQKGSVMQLFRSSTSII